MIIRCIGGPLEGSTFELDPTQVYILGRKPQNNESKQEILLDSRSVSRQHGELFYEGGRWSIRDLDSFNGIRVNQLKIKEAALENQTVFQTGEYTFICEGDVLPEERPLETNEPREVSYHARLEQTASPQTKEKPKKRAAAFFKYYKKFENLDFKIKSAIVLILTAFISHQFIVRPLISESRRNTLIESLRLGRAMTKYLGDRNLNFLKEQNFFLLDCRFLDGDNGVLEGYLFDAQGNLVCPVGGEFERDALLTQAIERHRAATDCGAKVLNGEGRRCEFTYPILSDPEGFRSQELVGVSRIVFEPESAFMNVQSLRALSWKLFVFIFFFVGAAAFVIFRWFREALEGITDTANLAYSGTVQSVEKLTNFSPLNPLINEINRLIAKSNQGDKADFDTRSEEASFLQSILQQVLLLEERAMMVVDTENHIIASSQTVPEMIPLNLELEKPHVSEAIEDTHLQGELLSFLNDLSMSAEVIDRPLSLADRVVHTEGMPLFFKEEHVASLVYFPAQ